MGAIRPGRFFDINPSCWSLLKIGEYQRTPLFEPSLKAMCLTLTDIRVLLRRERKASKIFNKAWEEAERLYEVKSLSIPDKFVGPKEYYIAIICYTLEDPVLYADFNKKCQNLTFEILESFPYKSLLFLLVQAELRMKVEANIRGRYDQTYYRVYRALHRSIKIDHFKARDLVAFNELTPTTADPNIALENIKRTGGTLIEIDRLCWSAKNIEQYSAFPMEQEVLIWPWSKFYIEKVEMVTSSIQKLVIKPTSHSFVDLG